VRVEGLGKLKKFTSSAHEPVTFLYSGGGYFECQLGCLLAKLRPFSVC
jgi:hypothetical protein